jgi:hypothetical protein
MKKIILAATFVLTATSGALAQDFYSPRYGYYDVAPGYSYGAAPGYSYYYGATPGYGYYASPPAWFENDTQRGGPGPRVGAGSGMGIGSQR